MLLLRRVTFALFTGAYLVVCPLTILYALGYVVHPLAGEGLLKTGLISVESRPEGAILYLEGKRYAHRTPAIIPGLRPGRYALRVAARGHRPWHGVVTVEAEQATALDHLLLLPRRLPAQRLLRGPFQQLRGIPDTRFLLLAHGRRLADLLVYDSASGEARPLTRRRAPHGDARLSEFITVHGSPLALAGIRHDRADRWLALRMDRPDSGAADLTALFPVRPEQVVWDPERPETLYAVQAGGVSRLDLARRVVHPRIAEDVRACGVRGEMLYLLGGDDALRRARLDGTGAEFLLQDVELGRGFLGLRSAVDIRPLDDGLVALSDARGRLLLTNGAWVVEGRDIRGVAYDPPRRRLLLWRREALGVLDVPGGEEVLRPAAAPAVRWLDIESRDIRQAFWLYDSSHVLWVDDGAIRLAQLPAAAADVGERLVETRPEASVHYADERGTLYYLERDTGALASLVLVPGRERGVRSLPERVLHGAGASEGR